MSNGTLKIGSESPDNIYIGADGIDKIYQGQDLIWTKPQIYGWHVDPTISDPYQAVTYLADARDKESVSLYRQVEYLKSTGTQCIMTDIIPIYTDRIELDVKFGYNVSSGERRPVGFLNSDGAFTVYIDDDSTSNSDYDWFSFYIGFRWYSGQSWENQIKNCKVTERNTLVLQRPKSYWGTSTATVNRTISGTNPPIYSIAIFGTTDGQGTIYPMQRRDMYLYGFKIYDENNNLIHDLIPTERTSDSELGLFDTVTGKFYANAGTGTFEKGSYIDNHIFGYGDWKDAFFMPKPCMLRSDGTVAYYLDPNDYTKKADGTASDVANASFDGNAMMEWPRIWYKFESLWDKGYRAVEYLRSTGTQYIQTDIIPNYQMKIESNIALGGVYQAGGHGGIFGTISDNRRFAFLLSMNGNLPKVYGYCGYPWSSPDSNFSFDSSWSILSQKNLWRLSHSEISVGSTVKTNLPAISQNPVENSLTIFAMINADSVIYSYDLSGYMMIYDFKIYDENNNIIHNLIPVERISDNELGLYDVITNKFYSNAGTGTFEKGNYVDGHGFFYCSPVKADNSYKCWCNYDCDDNIINHFYTAIYNGTGTSKLRSVSGVALTNTNGNGGTTVAQEVARATANNKTSKAEWYIDTWADRTLINALLILMSRSLNCQSIFGSGLTDGNNARGLKEAYITGSLNDKGLFWGDTSAGTSGVKVFGMENWWGCAWRRTAGLIGTSDGYAYKLTYGTADGSAANGYNTTASGYKTVAGRPSANDYITKMQFGDHGMLPYAGQGTASTYWCDYIVVGTGYAMCGGATYLTAGCGTNAFDLSGGPTVNAWNVTAALSCKPVKT